MFYKTISKKYHNIFPVKEVKLDFIKSHSKKMNLLEIGCSIGELCNLLGNDGYKVSGIDLDSDQIEIAKNNFKNNNNVSFHVENMNNIDILFKDEFFDTVLCLGNTLVHLDSEKEIKNFLGKVYQRLTNGGVFIGQIVNYDKIFSKNINSFPDISDNSFVFSRRYDLKSKFPKIIFESIFKLKNENPIKSSVLLYPIRHIQLLELLNLTNFVDIEFFGDFAENTYTKDSPAIVFKAYKN